MYSISEASNFHDTLIGQEVDWLFIGYVATAGPSTGVQRQ